MVSPIAGGPIGSAPIAAEYEAPGSPLPTIEGSYAQGRVVRRNLITFDLGSGTYRFWDGVGPLDYNGVTWQPGGGLILAQGIESTTRGEVTAVEITLRSIPDAGLTPDVLGTIHDEEWHQRPVSIWTLYIDPDTRAAINHIVKFTGKIDTISDRVNGDGVAELVGKAESYLRDLTRRGSSKRSNEQQQGLYSGDVFFQHSATVKVEQQYWGRATPQVAR